MASGVQDDPISAHRPRVSAKNDVNQLAKDRPDSNFEIGGSASEGVADGSIATEAVVADQKKVGNVRDHDVDTSRCSLRATAKIDAIPRSTGWLVLDLFFLVRLSPGFNSIGSNMPSLWGSKKADEEQHPDSLNHDARDSYDGGDRPSSSAREPDERTSLLPSQPRPRRSGGYLDPDDPAVCIRVDLPQHQH
jgi:hypothetical protein